MEDTLVLLPGLSPLSTSLSRSLLDAAYREPLTYVISKTPSSSKLTIAFAAPFQPVNWPLHQSLLADLYSIVVSVQATSAAIDVDTTVLLIDYSTSSKTTGNDTTVLTISTFASKPTLWSRVFYDGSKTGRELLSSFVDGGAVVKKDKLVALADLTLAEEGRSQNDEVTELYKTVVVAGTFDHLHIGHKLLIQASTLLLSLPRDASTPARLIIGISGGSLLTSKKYASEMESWRTRTQKVIDFLSATFALSSSHLRQETIGDDEEVHAFFFGGRLIVRCVKIVDVYGPTITEEDMDAIVLSAETRKGGAMINEKRVGRGWRKLQVHEIGVIHIDGQELESNANDFASKISSTEIRRRLAEAHGA
ncbi:pantetheine-phosphate adenylyltransferase family protein [Geosmithia morbida]|uniref:Pantetheine-phosphate adenylyltransferase family protein n=1 Tax=Geosmithia morbida TaxID=1094350 RepID=A0A9P5CZ62_9HYPO|nr:pantetheine-phosphate adenylyltransferase family protein [Geosmithia morbida]KAF4120107.1 pantetheine-phosphate adenylyltransferase family protein [Geosmithia morbida]